MNGRKYLFIHLKSGQIEMHVFFRLLFVLISDNSRLLA
jgi:hypothetical protein